MIKKIVSTAVILILCIVGIVLITKQNKTAEEGHKLQIVASFYPLYEFARQVGGDQVLVRNMTPAGAEPHDFEPSAKALADAKKANLFIYNGIGFESWVEAYVADTTQPTMAAAEGLSLGADPHYWLDPVLAQRVVKAIAQQLTDIDPTNAPYYAQRAETYGAKLMALDAAYKNGLAQCSGKTIVVSHDAFGYVAKRYDLTVQSIAGISPESEPTAARLAELADFLKQHGIKYVFFESLVSPRLADTIAREAGAQTLVLDPIEGLNNEDQQQGKNYLEVQYANLANLRKALTCQ